MSKPAFNALTEARRYRAEKRPRLRLTEHAGLPWAVDSTGCHEMGPDNDLLYRLPSGRTVPQHGFIDYRADGLIGLSEQTIADELWFHLEPIGPTRARVNETLAALRALLRRDAF